ACSRRIVAHRRCLLRASPQVVEFARIPLVAPGILPPVRPTRRLLPLRLCRQLHARPVTICLCILPMHVHYRMIFLPTPIWRDRHFSSCLLAKLSILPHCHLCLVDVVSIQSDRPAWVVTDVLVAHQEITCRDED